MHEFHGWFEVSESTDEGDAGTLASGIQELGERVAGIDWATGAASLLGLNGTYFLRVDGLINRVRDEADELYDLLGFVAERFPGSYGLLYERADEFPDPPGTKAFRVQVMARGKISVRLDPFLSPVNPVIED
jgi:hypothetical protein